MYKCKISFYFVTVILQVNNAITRTMFRTSDPVTVTQKLHGNNI